MLPFPALRHFSVVEFKHPELINNDFLEWLDTVRHVAGVPFVLTSDARTHEENKRVGGSPTSLHLFGRAVDFDVRKDTPDVRWKVMAAVIATPTPGGVGVEAEFVIADDHWHLGLFPDGRPSRLVLKAAD